MKDNVNPTLHIRIPVKQLDTLDRLAERIRGTRSQALRQLIDALDSGAIKVVAVGSDPEQSSCSIR